MRTRGPVNGFWSESGISISRISGMTSRKASEVKKKGHRDAREFARLLGIGREYKTNLFNTDEVDFLVKGEGKNQFRARKVVFKVSGKTCSE